MTTSKRLAAAYITISLAGLAFISDHEEVRTEPYLDAVGVVTVCAGHTATARIGQTKTQDECQILLREDASEAGRAVARCTTAALTQGQYDALVSLAFNIGGGAYCGSTLVKKLNAGDCRGAAAQFGRWVYAKGRVLRGLVKRRAEERAIFEAGCL